MTTLLRNFSLGSYQLVENSAQAGTSLASAFLCGLYYPTCYPSVSDKVVAHSFALKPAAETEMTDLTTTIIRTQRIG